MGAQSCALRSIFLLVLIGTVIGQNGKQCPELLTQERLLEKLVQVETKMNQILGDIEDQRQVQTRTAGPSQPLKIENLEADGWRMVFRASSGNGFNVFDAWTQGSNTHSVKPQSMERSLGQHYLDPIINSWDSLGIEYIKFALYNYDKEVAYVIFNGKGSDKTNWFSKDRVITSSYSDLSSTSAFNIFSVVGDYRPGDIERRFLVNSHYGGCPNDRGHLAVLDTKTVKGCAWDQHAVYPQFLYSLINSVDFWERRMFARADYMAIFVKTIL